MDLNEVLNNRRLRSRVYPILDICWDYNEGNISSAKSEDLDTIVFLTNEKVTTKPLLYFWAYENRIPMIIAFFSIPPINLHRLDEIINDYKRVGKISEIDGKLIYNGDEKEQ